MASRRIVIECPGKSYNFQVDMLEELIKLFSCIAAHDTVNFVFVEGEKSVEFPVELDIKTMWV